MSHSSADKDFVQEHIVYFLERHGIDTWFSAEDIISASDWEKTIRRALKECSWFLVVLTPDAITSPWVQAEVHWAMEHRMNHCVPVLAKDCEWQELHLMLRTRQLVRLNDNLEEGKAALLSVWEEDRRPVIVEEGSYKLLKEPVKCITSVCVRTGSSVRIVVGMSEAVGGVRNSKVTLPNLTTRANQSQLIDVYPDLVGGVNYLFATGECITVHFNVDESGNLTGIFTYETSLPVPCKATSWCSWYSPEHKDFQLFGCEDGTLFFCEIKPASETSSVDSGWKSFLSVEHKFPITSLSPSSKSVVVSGDSGGRINIWSQRNCELLHSLSLDSPVSTLAVDQNRSQILAFTGDGELHVLSYEGVALSTIQISGDPVVDTHFVSTYLACSTGTDLTLWDYVNNRMLFRFPIEGRKITKLQSERDGLIIRHPRLVVGDEQGTISSFLIRDPGVVSYLQRAPTRQKDSFVTHLCRRLFRRTNS